MQCVGGGMQCVEGRVGGCYLSKMDSCPAILNRLLTDFGAFSEVVDISDDTLDSFILSLEIVCRRLVVLEEINGSDYGDVLLGS